MNALEMLHTSGVTFRVSPNWKTARASRFSFAPQPGGTLGVMIHRLGRTPGSPVPVAGLESTHPYYSSSRVDVSKN